VCQSSRASGGIKGFLTLENATYGGRRRQWVWISEAICENSVGPGQVSHVGGERDWALRCEWSLAARNALSIQSGRLGSGYYRFQGFPIFACA
jgi:hypothetical protein